jgi:hypothetical protein
MTILGYLLLVVVVGVAVWLAINYVPMPDQFKRFLPIAAILILLVILLVLLFGGIGALDRPIPHVR